MRLSDIIFTIETSSKSNSLNLSHAVTVLSHKLFELNNLKITNSISIEKDNISKYQLSKFLNYVIEKLENKKFFTPKEKKESMKNNIYSIFTKIPLTKKELQTLWGITKKLNK